MSMDYKSNVYSYRRDPTGRQNEAKTSYGRMNEWQRDSDVFNASFLAGPRPLCHEAYLNSGERPDVWQGVKPKKVVEVMQARGQRHLFIYNDLHPVPDRPYDKKVDCECVPDERYDHLLGPSCYERYQLPQHKSMASVLCSPDMRLNRRSMMATNNNRQQQAKSAGECGKTNSTNEEPRFYPRSSLDVAILAGIDMPPRPRKYITRSEVLALERENWKMIR